MTTIDEVTAKVAKLLSLSERAGTPEEAAAAAGQAAKLMERFGIERADALAFGVEKDEAIEVFDDDAALEKNANEKGTISSYLPYWKDRLSHDLAYLYGCYTYRSTSISGVEGSL